MKLCVNYLEETKALLEEGKIDFIDYIKLYSINSDLSPLKWCITKKDVMFHGIVGENGSNIADKNFFLNRDLDLQRRYYDITKTPYISMHINALEEPIPNEHEAIFNIKKNVERLRKEFGREVILENIPGIIGRGEHNFYSNPDFISKVINETSCGFLFDIGHAKVASEVLNISFENYVKRLPMDKIIEVHLAGCMKNLNGNLVANHSKMHEEDYEFLKNLLKTSNTLRTVTLEYGTIKNKNIIGECPIVAYGIVNEKAKEEVYEQLMRIKKILVK